jgi:riboflavin biosynthesis pyrimidine reductase
MLASVDGKIAFHSNESTTERAKNGFTCDEDFERMRNLVAECDVVFIGARSIETEKGAFRVSNKRNTKDEPEWIIFTQSGNISFKSSFWKQSGIPKSIFFASSFNSNEPPILRVEEKDFGFAKITCYLGNISGLLNFLNKQKKSRAALLGGGKLNAAFWQNNLVNELNLTLSPIIVGDDQAPKLFEFKSIIKQKLKLKNIFYSNNFVFIDYAIEEN